MSRTCKHLSPPHTHTFWARPGEVKEQELGQGQLLGVRGRRRGGGWRGGEQEGEATTSCGEGSGGKGHGLGSELKVTLPRCPQRPGATSGLRADSCAEGASATAEATLRPQDLPELLLPPQGPQSLCGLPLRRPVVWTSGPGHSG